ncbi:sigma factor-like helix-turn-helix DNA-binding protein [Micromonospora sp. NPDC049900]|uniref:sigma factor-like helix-turn-helix DNA-binding protein n=1 Tax=unclassified Micromonospora TaxID=2617518 RepID=UPI00379E5289
MGLLRSAWLLTGAVCRALARLTRRQRAIVVLRYVEDLSVAQIAAVLGCPTGTVEAATHQSPAPDRLDAVEHRVES